MEDFDIKTIETTDGLYVKLDDIRRFFSELRKRYPIRYRSLISIIKLLEEGVKQ